MVKNITIILTILCLTVGCLSDNRLPASEPNVSLGNGASLDEVSITATPLITFQDSIFEQEVGSFQMTLVDEPPSSADEIVVNTNGDFQIYVSCNPLCSMFVQDLKADRTYILTSSQLDGRRGFRNVEWVDGHKVGFVLVTQPNYGVRYVVDVQKQQLVELSPVQEN